MPPLGQAFVQALGMPRVRRSSPCDACAGCGQPPGRGRAVFNLVFSQAAEALPSLGKLIVTPCPQRSRAETRPRSHTPSCRAARAWRWGMSCCTCARRATSRATAKPPSPCCVTAVGSGTAWRRPAGQVSRPHARGAQPPHVLAGLGGLFSTTAPLKDTFRPFA